MTAGALAMFLSPGERAAIPLSADAVVGVALEVRNVITAENDTNPVRRISANLMNTPAQLKASHSRSQRIPLWRFRLPPASSPSGYPPDPALLGARDCESSEI